MNASVQPFGHPTQVENKLIASQLYMRCRKRTRTSISASRRKFAKLKVAYGLAMGGQTDSQVGSQVHGSRKNLTSRIYR